ncbi:MAG: hypothetical protein DRR08_27010 [Candidatus Parabeggiatoa sp. nov. 2]|nr:MAG: hypothetical protein B6247_21915 [Beggiatoa sp. 4572_84]RKZ53855.1 MAG: hypothetical protein DRR08_27010 [Gammaproteobacteria bacterium]HEC84124.1 hypothetical protein [Thioploca sp.]
MAVVQTNVWQESKKANDRPIRYNNGENYPEGVTIDTPQLKPPQSPEERGQGPIDSGIKWRDGPQNTTLAAALNNALAFARGDLSLVVVQTNVW